jgi:hypothetical protein
MPEPSLYVLCSADLRWANFGFYSFTYVHLEGANLSGTDLSRSEDLDETFGRPYYSRHTKFNLSSYFDPVAANWILLPEPTSGLLLGLGLLGVAVRRRM